MRKESSKKIGSWLLALLSAAVFSGCARIAEVAAPEAQEVNAQIRTVVETDRIYDNISVNNISVGGLTKDEAKMRLEEELLSPIKSQKIIVKYDEKTWPLELMGLDYSYDVEKAVEEAFSVARTGTPEERYDKVMELRTSPYTITLEPKYDKNRIIKFLSDLADEVNVPPVEPAATRQNRELVTSPGSDGVSVNITDTKDRIIELADKLEGGEVNLVVTAVSPKFTEEDLRKGNTLIGSFSTPITGSPSRDVNLTVASGYINGMTVYPGDIFSTNEAIGPTTYDRGYRVAPVIVNGKLEDGIGGGVCQVSSTLYNAVLYAELSVVERRNHSLMVGYVAAGRDATLAGDVIDLKFKNDSEYPVYIESYLENKRLYVNIYGHETRPANRTVDFETVNMGNLVYDVYKKVFVDGTIVERMLVDRSKYKPPTPAEPTEAETPEEVPVSPETPAEETPVDPNAPPEGINWQPLEDNSVTPEWLDTRPADFGTGSEADPWPPLDFIEE